MFKLFGAAGILALLYSCDRVIAERSPVAPAADGGVETGAHWAAPADFLQLKRLGYQFAVITFDADPQHWTEAFDQAERAGIRLIAGLHPYPYRLDKATGEWHIDGVGEEFIAFAQSRSNIVKALYVFNEPYWVDPASGVKNPCGALAANDLRKLRLAIGALWPRVKIYHDIGRPSQWAPGGGYALENPCIDDRFADASGIADLVGVWHYPVAKQGYDRETLVQALRVELDYVSQRMNAEAIVLGQAFRCSRCAGPTRMPALDEVRDINCTVRWLAPQAISWYPWRQPAYEESLERHRELWPATSPRACQQ